MANDFKAIIGIAYDLKKAQSELDRQIKSLQKNTKLALDLELSDKEAKKVLSNSSKMWSNYRKESVQAITAPNTELQKMSKYYQNLEKDIQSQISAQKKMATSTEQAYKTNESYNQKAIANQKSSYVSTEQAYKANEKINTSVEMTKIKADSAQKSLSAYVKTLKPSEVKKQSDEIRAISDSLEKVKQTGNKADFSKVTTQIQNLKSGMKEVGAETKSFGQALSGDIKRFAQWTLSATILMGAINTIREMVTETKELNKSTISLKKVTDETDATYSKFLKDAAQSAKELGSNISDFVESTADFARLGYGLPDAKKLSEVATLYKNIGDGIDINQSTESIISTLKAFNIEAEDSIEIVDKLNAVGNTQAISSAGIGTALQKSASAMASANNTLDESIALITAGNTVVQDADAVGTALKTVSLRLRSTSADLEKMGEDTDGAAETVSNLRELLLGLTKQKVDIQLDEDTYKSTYQIMLEMSKVWNSMNDMQQASALESMFGKRQANIGASIIQNMADAETALATSLSSAGSAMAEQEKYMQGIEYSEDRLKASMQELASTTLNSDWVKGFYDALNAVVNLTTAMGGLIPVGTAVGTVFLASKVGLLSFTASSVSASVAQVGLAGSITATTTAMKTFLLTNPIGWLVLLAGTIGGVAVAYDAATTSIEEHREKIDSLQSSYDALNSEFEELSGKQELTGYEQDRLEYLKQRLALDKEILEVEQRQEAEKVVGTSFSDVLDKDSLLSKQASEENAYSILGFKNKNRFEDMENVVSPDVSLAKDVREEITSLIQQQSKLTEGSAEYNNIQREINANRKLEEKLISETTSYQDKLTAKESEFLDNYQQAQDAVNSGLLSGEAEKKAKAQEGYWKDQYETVKSLREEVQKLNGTYASPKVTTDDKLSKKFTNVSTDDLSTLSDEDKEIALTFNPNNKIGFEELQQMIADTKSELAELDEQPLSFTETIKKLDEMTESLGKLDSAYASAMDGGVSYSDISSLMAEFGDVSGIEDYIGAIQDAKGNTELTKTAFNNLVTAYIDSTGILNNLTDKNAKYVASMLEEQGVANANEIVTNQLAAAKEYAALASQDLENGIISEINTMALEDGAISASEQSLIAYAIGKQTANLTTLSSVNDIDALIAIVDALGYATDALDIYKSAKAGAGLGSGGYVPVGFEVDDTSALQEIKDALNGASNIDYTGGASTKKASSSGSSSKDAYLEAYKKELAQLDHLHEMGQISEKEYLDNLRELNESYFNNTASNHEKYLDEYQANEEKIFSGMQSYYKEYFDDQISALSTFRGDELKSYQERSVDILNEINNLNAQAQISAETYADLLTSYFENQKTQYQAAAQYAQKVIQKQIKSIQAKSDAFKNAKEDEIDDIEDEIDALNDQKDEVENYYNDQINSIQKVIDARQAEIDAINEKTEAEKLQYDLEQKQYLLQQARSQRTVNQFTGGEFKYTANTDSIRDAQENVNEAQSNITVNNLSKQIDGLEAQQADLTTKMNEQTTAIENQITALEDKKSAIQEVIDETTAKYQEQIDSLQAYSDQWAAVTEEQTTAEEAKIAMEILGATSENDILNNRQAMLALFGENYKTITDNLATVAQANADQMSSIASQMAKAAEKAMEAAKKMAAAKAKMGSSKYASGTKNAKEGLNEVAEGGKPEIVKFNDGTYSLYNDRSLVPMEGGETVYNGNETSKLLRQRSADLVSMIKSGTVGNFSAQNSIASNLQSSIPSTSSFKTTTNNKASNVVVNMNLPNVKDKSDAEPLLLEFTKRLNQDSQIDF